MTLADHAMYLAKATGRNRVCTWEMVKYRRLAEAIGMDRGATADARRTQFIESARASLGPCQLEHLTSHCESVAALAYRTARRLMRGVNPNEQARLAEQARMAGLLHDIGKCAVPEEIVSKRGELSADERWLMNAHTQEGAAIAEALGMDEAVVTGIRDHHRWHARPRGIDEAIEHNECTARVLAVADAVVAMTTDRPYRAARPMADAIAEIRKFDGCQFEHAAVEAVAGISAGVRAVNGAGTHHGRRAA
jgi:putative nucleotidyltransferase with HDIG domain